jgi:hypothetical protein
MRLGELLGSLRAQNVYLTDANYTSLRAVMHLDVSTDQVLRAAEIVASTIRA